MLLLCPASETSMTQSGSGPLQGEIGDLPAALGTSPAGLRRRAALAGLWGWRPPFVRCTRGSASCTASRRQAGAARLPLSPSSETPCAMEAVRCFEGAHHSQQEAGTRSKAAAEPSGSGNLCAWHSAVGLHCLQTPAGVGEMQQGSCRALLVRRPVW